MRETPGLSTGAILTAAVSEDSRGTRLRNLYEAEASPHYLVSGGDES